MVCLKKKKKGTITTIFCLARVHSQLHFLLSVGAMLYEGLRVLVWPVA